MIREPVTVEQSRIAQLERQIEGLSRALQTRDIIGQAKGILVSRYALGPDEAFALLVRLSQNTNTKLSDLAADLVGLVRERGRRGHGAVPAVVDGLLARSGKFGGRAPRQAGAPDGGQRVPPQPPLSPVDWPQKSETPVPSGPPEQVVGYSPRAQRKVTRHG